MVALLVTTPLEETLPFIACPERKWFFQNFQAHLLAMDGVHQERDFGGEPLKTLYCFLPIPRGYKSPPRHAEEHGTPREFLVGDDHKSPDFVPGTIR